MKKTVSLMTAIVLSMSLLACGAEPDTAATEKDTASAEAVEVAASPSPSIKPHDKNHIDSLMDKSPVMQALNGKDAKTESWEDYDEYNSVIRAMGFNEFHAGYDLLSEEEIAYFGAEKMYEAMGPQFKLEELKYNGEVFRLDLDYTDFDYGLYEQEGRPGKLIDGWIILGCKADSAANISGFENEDFDYGGSINHAELFPELYDGYCEKVEYSFYNLDENEMPTVLVQCTAIYYPESGNLYNIIKASYDNLLEGTTYFPAVLYPTREIADIEIADRFN